MTAPRQSASPLPGLILALLATISALAYWIVFSTRNGGAVILVALPCLFLLYRVRTARQAFYLGLVTGIAMYAPPLGFFFKVFGPSALALYLIAGLPIAIFVLLTHLSHRRLAPRYLLLLTPMLWTGIEFFRSELYWLRFAWLLPGQAVAFLPGLRWMSIGVYGVGFIFAFVATLVVGRNWFLRGLGILLTIGIAILMYWPWVVAANTDATLYVAGVQLEFPSTEAAADALDHLAIAHREAQILVLSEYSFYGPVPPAVREVVRRHHRYLIAGGIRTLPNGAYNDTAFVIGPDGSDVFEQGKSVPVQFMMDGQPAKERHVWNSPWGKIGIAICYDVSYARVLDDFVQQGAQGLIIPTEDAKSWGKYEREMLHGRMAPIRSAEYGIPIFSVWSSGISQLTNRDGQIIASGGYPGQGETIEGPFDLKSPDPISPAHIPADRMLANACVVGTGLLILYLVTVRFRRIDSPPGRA